MHNNNRHRTYNDAHQIIRVNKEFKEMLSKHADETGLSHFQVIKKLLKAKFNKGYQKGYDKAVSDLSKKLEKKYLHCL